jgi:hypothetical protein
MDFSIFLQRTIPPCLILFAALLAPNTTYHTHLTRVSIFIIIVSLSATSLRSHEISNPIISYFIGFGAVFTIIHSAVLIIISHPCRDFKRVRPVKNLENEVASYEWEKFPENDLLRRIGWVLDLMFNLRGIGWNYCPQPSTLPLEVLKLYQFEPATKVHVRNSQPTTHRKTLSRTSWLLHQITRLVVVYLILDLTTALMQNDPWLNGSGPYDPFSLPAPERDIWFLLLGYRIFLVAVGAFGFIDIGITSLGLVCVGVFGEKWIGTWGEQWMWPGLWGNVWELWNHGLIGKSPSFLLLMILNLNDKLIKKQGLWGKVWHPLIKTPFTTFARAIMPSIPPSSSSKTSTASNIERAIRFHLIFALSGLLHATGSFTQNQKTYPAMQFAGMFLQAPGIILQLLIERMLKAWGMRDGVRKTLVLVWVILWATPTAYMVTGDVARSGMFQVKILPLSVIDLCLKSIK